MVINDYVLTWKCIAPGCNVEIYGDSQRTVEKRMVVHITQKHQPVDMREKTDTEKELEVRYGHR